MRTSERLFLAPTAEQEWTENDMTEYKKQELLRKIDKLLDWTSVNPLEDMYSHAICEVLYSLVSEIKTDDGERKDNE